MGLGTPTDGYVTGDVADTVSPASSGNATSRPHMSLFVWAGAYLWLCVRTSDALRTHSNHASGLGAFHGRREQLVGGSLDESGLCTWLFVWGGAGRRGSPPDGSGASPRRQSQVAVTIRLDRLVELFLHHAGLDWSQAIANPTYFGDACDHAFPLAHARKDDAAAHPLGAGWLSNERRQSIEVDREIRDASNEGNEGCSTALCRR